MRPIHLIWFFAFLAVAGDFSAQASPFGQTPGSLASGDSAQNGSSTPAEPANPTPPATLRARLFGRFRRSVAAHPSEDQTKPDKTLPAQEPPVGDRHDLTDGVRVSQPSNSRAKSHSSTDAPVRRVQATVSDLTQPSVPSVSALVPSSNNLSNLAIPPAGGQSISLQAALYGAITSNPDLVTLREGNALAASAEAVEVARHFPTTLNPTVWIDYRPITLVPNGTFGTQGGAMGHSGTSTSSQHGFYHFGQDFINVSIRQPFELGHQTTHRYRIAQAAYDQQRWIVLQAELTALVQTYRLFQTAAYRREKYRLAQQLADFNDRLSDTLQKRMEANQVQGADVALARVESRASRQQVKAARQDYLVALTDLRNQVGIPEQAGALEPLGEFTLPAYIPPIDEQVMIQEAIQSRPDIHAANAQVTGTYSAIDLARGDRIPTPVIGPQYSMDEAGVQYVGFVLISTLPVWNNGKPLVAQREAEHRRAIVASQQAQQRAVAQVRSAVAKWNSANELVNESAGLTKDLNKEVGTLDRLFEAGQVDLTKLMQARQRLIQLENSQLDAVWQATQAQSDLLLALGMPSLIHKMLERAEADDTPSAPGTSGPVPLPVPATVRP
jgi:outer membrane protein, heavy metal efflux system